MSYSGTNAIHAMALAAREVGGDDTPTSTILEAAVATVVAVAAAASNTDNPDEAPEGECRLMGPFALLVQLALGALALLSLVFKRWRERPQRPVKIWFFDASKQVFGSVLVHIANVFMSLLTSGRFSVKAEPGIVATAAGQAVRRLMAREEEVYTPNPCSFYLLNLAIDTTIGIPILIFLLRIMTGLIAYTPMGKPAESIQSGYYGSPPRVWWWLKQSVIYFMGLMGMKLVVLLIFLILPWISKVGDWALGWTEGNEKLQIAFVMMIFPLIMNAMQYYIIDSFIKKKDTDATADSEHERVPGEDPDERRAFGEDAEGGEELLTGSTSDDEDDDGRDGRDSRAAVKKHRLSLGGEDEYDPDKDGEAPTVIGSTSSSRGPQRSSVKVVEPQLLPKE